MQVPHQGAAGEQQIRMCCDVGSQRDMFSDTLVAHFQHITQDRNPTRCRHHAEQGQGGPHGGGGGVVAFIEQRDAPHGQLQVMPRAAPGARGERRQRPRARRRIGPHQMRRRQGRQRVGGHMQAGGMQTQCQFLAAHAQHQIGAVGIGRGVQQAMGGVGGAAETFHAGGGGTAHPIEVRAVGGQQQHAARLQSRRDACLLIGYRLGAAEMADMGGADGGHHRHMRSCQPGERGDFARMVHADLIDGKARILRHAGQRERHAPMIVIGRLCRMGAALGGENAAQHLLHRRLAHRSGNGGEPAGEARAGDAAERVQAVKRIGDFQKGRIFKPVRDRMHQRARSTIVQRLGHEAMTVAILTNQGDEQLPLRHIAAVDGHAIGVEGPDHLT